MSPVIFAAKAPTTKRPDHDVYETPLPLAAACIAILGRYAGPYDDHVLDTGAGSGVWGEAWKDYTNAGVLFGVEVRDVPRPREYFHWCAGIDYLSWYPKDYGFSVIMGNPPYRHAEAFIRKSLGLLAFKGVLGYLLPSGFQHGVKRGRGLFREYPPVEVASLMQRPNFAGMGRANVNDYIFVVWQKDNPAQTRHTLLDWKAEPQP